MKAVKLSYRPSYLNILGTMTTLVPFIVKSGMISFSEWIFLYSHLFFTFNILLGF